MVGATDSHPPISNTGEGVKVLNLYAGIGGNRKLWTDVEVTAVELDPKIAKIYKDFFPQDEVIVGDAHQYLLEHFKEFEFIWSSPPCPSHSRARFWGHGENKPIYPDMTLYEEILFLKHYFNGKWVVENVKPYYQQLLPSYELGRHLYWSNFHITYFEVKEFDIRSGNNQEGSEIHGFDASKYEGVDKKKILRNCVEPELGLHIFNESKREVYTDLFNPTQEKG